MSESALALGRGVRRRLRKVLQKPSEVNYGCHERCIRPFTLAGRERADRKDAAWQHACQQ